MTTSYDGGTTNWTQQSDHSAQPSATRALLPLRAEAYAVPAVFAAIFVLGLTGNATIIYTVARNKRMRNTPNMLLVSLALGDLLLIVVSVPFTCTIYTFNEWPYGEYACKLNEFLQALSLGVSVFTLTALGGERYLAIVHPLTSRRAGSNNGKSASSARTIALILGIWLLASSLAAVEAVAARIRRNNYDGTILDICDIHPPSWGVAYRKTHAVARLVVYFIVPLTIIGSFYALMARILWISSSIQTSSGAMRSEQSIRQIESRKKLARLVLSFVVVFAACWLPRHIYVMWYHFDPGLYNLFWHWFKIVGFCLSFLNSCANPFTLYLLSSRFRRYYNKYLFRCFCSVEARNTSSGRRAESTVALSGKLLYGHHVTVAASPPGKSGKTRAMSTSGQMVSKPSKRSSSCGHLRTVINSR